jgi:hypothetical protein
MSLACASGLKFRGREKIMQITMARKTEKAKAERFQHTPRELVILNRAHDEALNLTVVVSPKYAGQYEPVHHEDSCHRSALSGVLRLRR